MPMLRAPRLVLFFLAAWLTPALAQTSAPEVVILGLGDALKRNVELLLGIEQKRTDPELTDEQLRALHAKAPQEIRHALEPFGYYRAQVRSELTREGDHWVARY